MSWRAAAKNRPQCTGIASNPWVVALQLGTARSSNEHQTLNKWMAEEENMTRSLEDLNHVTNYAPRKKRLNHP
jgi:uroporphyrinogen-III decarboxylase